VRRALRTPEHYRGNTTTKLNQRTRIKMLSRKFRFESLLFALILLIWLMAHNVQAQQLDQLIWEAPTTDEAGEPLAGVPLTFNLYGRVAGDDFPLAPQQAYDSSPADLSAAPKGCYDLYLTAVRMDSTPPLESAPSNMITACFGYASGEEGPDGFVGACDGDEPDDPVIIESPDEPDDLDEFQRLPTSSPIIELINRWRNSGRNN